MRKIEFLRGLMAASLLVITLNLVAETGITLYGYPLIFLMLLIMPERGR